MIGGRHTNSIVRQTLFGISWRKEKAIYPQKSGCFNLEEIGDIITKTFNITLVIF